MSTVDSQVVGSGRAIPDIFVHQLLRETSDRVVSVAPADELTRQEVRRRAGSHRKGHDVVEHQAAPGNAPNAVCAAQYLVAVADPEDEVRRGTGIGFRTLLDFERPGFAEGPVNAIP
ncbi:MAG TPA: hypothetical protein VHC18_16150 [Amycolatopsis sp.]|nr:hypothetical protein [Amycolatopsis sp.]